MSLKQRFTKVSGIFVLAAAFAFSAFTPEAQAQGYGSRNHTRVGGSIHIGSGGYGRGHIGVDIHIGNGRSHGNIHYRHRTHYPSHRYPDHHYPSHRYPSHRHLPPVIVVPPRHYPRPVVIERPPVIIEHTVHQHDLDCGHYDSERIQDAIQNAAESIYYRGYSPAMEVRQINDSAREIQRLYAPGIDSRIIEDEIRDTVSAIRQTALEQQEALEKTQRKGLPTPPPAPRR